MTPDQLAKSGTEHAEQRALFAWANMALLFGVFAANDPKSYIVKDYAKNLICPDSPVTQLKWLHAIHNQGHGDAIHGARAKAEGVKAGVADLFLPVPIKTYDAGHVIDVNDGEYEVSLYCGLYIEMKRADKGKLSIEQSEFAKDMQDVGYKWVCCFGWKNARDEILKYLGLV